MGEKSISLIEDLQWQSGSYGIPIQGEKIGMYLASLYESESAFEPRDLA
jgi:hypothetical protein